MIRMLNKFYSRYNMFLWIISSQRTFLFLVIRAFKIYSLNKLMITGGEGSGRMGEICDGD